MKAWTSALLALFVSPLALAGDGIDQSINEAIAPISNFIVSIVFYSVPVGEASLPLIVVWLVVAAIFFTVYFGFVNVRGFTHAIRVVRGDYTNPRDKGEVSHFQALTAALSGTVGLGNIAGVAIAVSIGGPGATFWMIIGGLLGMSSKFVECTLGVKYRNINADGTVSGGPMYYLSKGLAEQGRAGLGKFLAVFFAICCIGGAIGAGNMFQANQAVQQVISVTGGESSIFAGQAWLLGLILAFLVGVVIIGGIKSIAHVTEKVVPFMAGIYVAAAIVILAMNVEKIPEAFGLIFAGAFSAAGVTGGVIGCMIQGFKRASFSNEAGIGSAAIAHSAVKTNEPLSEGFVSLLEPFIDTVVICTMTALVIVITGAYANEAGLGGVALTSSAFESAISWFPYVLAIAVVLFAFSTMLSWSYYGTKAWTYLFGESRASDLAFKLIFCAFVVVGASMSLGPVIDFSDSMIFAMSIANIAGLYMLAPVVKRELSRYRQRVAGGEIRNFRKEGVESDDDADPAVV